MCFFVSRVIHRALPLSGEGEALNGNIKDVFGQNWITVPTKQKDNLVNESGQDW